MEYFSRNYRHLKSKILHKFHCLLFVFFSILVIFFPISPIQTSQKILNIFVVLYCTDYRFYQRILENSWIFIKKIEILSIQNIFRISSFTIYFFNFLVYLTSFFSILPVYCFQKNCKIFVLFSCIDPTFYQKILQKYGFVLKISTKFHRLLFLFYFFSIFGIWFSISPIQTCPIIMEFFVVF